MGGSGSRWPTPDPTKDLRRLQAAESLSLSEEFEVEANASLGDLLRVYNDRDAAAVERHLQEIQDSLESALEGDLTLRMGGSVARHTYVDGLSDVDALVLVQDTELADASPEQVREFLAERLSRRFPRTNIEVGRMAVTVHFADIDIQLVPALKSGERVMVGTSRGDAWASIDPRAFARRLTEANNKSGRLLVPVVKLAKAIIAGLPESQRISGYHVESLAIDVFNFYEGRSSLRAMLRHFFESASKRVLHPMPDLTGQSVHVDDDLGPARSTARRVVGDSLERVARKMASADAAGDPEMWRQIVEG